jgi:precorrin-6B methylase 2
MLALLNAIKDLSSLSRLIVLEECANPGSTVAYDAVELVDVDDDRREVRNGDGELLFTLHERDDDLCFQRGAAVDERLNFALALLGTGKKGRGLAEGDWISYTVMEDRAAAVDQAFVLLKQLRDVAGIQGDVLPLAAEILELARRWRTVRQAIYDADNSAWVSMRAAVNVEAQEQALVTDFNAFNDAREVAGHPLRLKRESDPRGTAITVLFRGEQPRTLGLVGLPMSWLPHVEAPAKPSRRAAGKTAPAQVGAPSTTRIPEDVAQVLAAAHCEGLNLRLSGQLEPKLYAKVDRALKGMGAKWVSAKNAHVFKAEAAPVIQAALGAGAIVTDRNWEFFPTPQTVVQKMLSKVTLRQGMKAGEPNGGEGAIALELAKVLGRENVQCFELMPRNVATLAGLGFPVVEGDFLAQVPSPRFDLICMNPPFANLADTLHIEHAAKFLKPGGELVAICSPSWQLRSSARAIAFREWLASLDADIEPLPAGAFRESGTDIATLMLTIRMPAAPASVVKAQERAEVLAPVRDQLDLFAEAA